MYRYFNFIIFQTRYVYILTVLSLLSLNVESAAPPLPTIPGAATPTATTDPIDIVIDVFKYVGAAMIWLAVAWFGLQMFWAVIKATNEARGGEASWMEAGKSMVGNIMMFVLFLAVAVWYTAAFL